MSEIALKSSQISGKRKKLPKGFHTWFDLIILIQEKWMKLSESYLIFLFFFWNGVLESNGFIMVLHNSHYQVNTLKIWIIEIRLEELFGY